MYAEVATASEPSGTWSRCHEGSLELQGEHTLAPCPIHHPCVLQVRQVAEENGVDVSEQIKELEDRSIGLRQDTYERLTPVQRLQVARHPSRPTFLDIAYNVSDKFVELHGDRGGLDDAAIVCGLASIDGVSFMLVGQQKGRNTKENILRNFAMPQPNGYRKALRFMK